jgi:dipeptidyl aminopeptidase/acylaminoacyl peptidase
MDHIILFANLVASSAFSSNLHPMRKSTPLVLFLFLFITSRAIAGPADSLTIEKIMADPSWIGISPSNVFWSPDGRTVYFTWDASQSLQENEYIYVGGSAGASLSDSLYAVTLSDHRPRKVAGAEKRLAEAERSGSWNEDRSMMAFTDGHSLYLWEARTDQPRLLIGGTATLAGVRFSFHDSCVVFRRGANLFSYRISGGQLRQLTDFRSGRRPSEDSLSRGDRLLRSDALANSAVLTEREKEKKDQRAFDKKEDREGMPRIIYTRASVVAGMAISPDGRFVVYRLMKKASPAPTRVPDYVTASGRTADIAGRPLAGAPQPSFHSWVYDRAAASVYGVPVKDIPGIRDIPAYMKDYPSRDSVLRRHPPLRSVIVLDPLWNAAGTKALVVVRALDHKDRWIMLLDAATGKLSLLDRQHDDAWVGGPGTGWDFGSGNIGWLNDSTVWYQSEKTGYSHLYKVNARTRETRALDSGRYEVQQAELSADGRTLYIVTNRTAPAQTGFWRMDVATGAQTRVTTLGGGNVVTVSPDGTNIAFLHSTAVHPWELYLQPNKAGTKAVRITRKAESAAYRSYPWREPRLITFTDRDGLAVHASVYKPAVPAASRPGVLFVHGAGYLQDVDHWWSYYFREHMFINLLCDHGYTVMDVDYRGSAGYGRDWRTAIYRHMGGSDLDDEVDAARYMADSLGVDRARIGIWGGSYGGFLTLMALFKTQDFACGAALRAVTDWAHYNHGYTTDILNDPANDSLAYVRSSPIYFASGLHGRLLMCHGMVDSNVHFQDIVRLTQKLIELGRHDWQLAVYPLESHDFREPSSWIDEYTRVYRLLESCLK